MDVFDFDGTLIRVNSFTEICKATLVGCLLGARWRQVVSICLLYARRRAGGLDHLEFKEAMMRYFEGCFSVQERSKLINGLFIKNANYKVVEAMMCCERCVISTAAPYAYMSLLDFGRSVTLIASLAPGSNLVDRSNQGLGKVCNIEAVFEGEAVSIDRFFTDDLVADAALVTRASKAYLVRDGGIELIK